MSFGQASQVTSIRKALKLHTANDSFNKTTAQQQQFLSNLPDTKVGPGVHLHQQKQLITVYMLMIIDGSFLVAGFNLFEIYYCSQIGSSPQLGVKIKHI